MLSRRLFPLLAAAGLILIGITSTLWWAPVSGGRLVWSVPHDLWGTMLAASRLLHGDLGGLYTKPTGLITLPGGALILVPLVAVIDAAGLSLRLPGPHFPQPGAWLLAGPYETALSAVALFAADAIAEHLGVGKRQRAALAAAGAVALWNVSVRWGHPEDAVAVGLLLYAVLALARGRTGRSGWLVGAALAIQPLVVLAVPVLVCVLQPRRVAGFLARSAAPGAVLLGIAAAANWTATFTAITRQPNWPSVDHPTPWLALATPLRSGAVAAGPVRLLAVLVACGCGCIAWRQFRDVRGQPWSQETLLRILWLVAVTLALRSVFEPVMVAFYLWPVLAVALITAAVRWSRLIAVAAIGAVLTYGSQMPWHSPWAWWLPVMAGLGAVLLLARMPGRAEIRAPALPRLDVGSPVIP